MEEKRWFGRGVEICFGFGRGLDDFLWCEKIFEGIGISLGMKSSRK